MAAWGATREWIPEDFREYRIFVSAQSDKYSGQPFTCEDFALNLVSEFAAQAHLPVSILGGKKISSRDEQYKSKQEFVDALCQNTAAWHLRSPENTKLLPHSLALVKPGSLLLHVRYGGTDSFHTQVVVRRMPRAIWVYQGNIGLDPLVKRGYRAISPFNPGSPVYKGVAPQFGAYEIDGSGIPLRYEGPFGVISGGVLLNMWKRTEVRDWNTEGW